MLDWQSFLQRTQLTRLRRILFLVSYHHYSSSQYLAKLYLFQRGGTIFARSTMLSLQINSKGLFFASSLLLVLYLTGVNVNVDRIGTSIEASIHYYLGSSSLTMDRFAYHHTYIDVRKAGLSNQNQDRSITESKSSQRVQSQQISLTRDYSTLRSLEGHPGMKLSYFLSHGGHSINDPSLSL